MKAVRRADGRGKRSKKDRIGLKIQNRKLNRTAALWLGACLFAGGFQASAVLAEETEGYLPERQEETALPAAGEGFFQAEETEPVLPAAGSWLPKELPARYDAREEGKTPVVKSQGSLGTCWALVVTSALEAALMPQEHLIFSADHMSLNNGFEITQNEGGDYMMAMAYLSGWYGPVLEEEDPYGDGYSPEGLNARVHVQEMQLLEGMSGQEIKEMIYRYGPVQTSLYLDRKTTSRALDYYREETAAYYVPQEEKPIHDVLILGWDDTYPKENFKIQPDQDGAYICQNSWGEDFGEDGIFYVSYQDANIARGGVAYTGIEPADNYDRIYQTDVCGWQGQQGYETESCYFANVYTAEEEENLEAVGFYATDSYTSYEVYVVRDFADETSFEKMEWVQSGWQKNSGYYTVKLEEPVELNRGERFAVAVKITTPGADKPVAVELEKDRYTRTVTLESKEGYLSLYGEVWEFTEEKFGTNVCLKAYTSLRKGEESGNGR